MSNTDGNATFQITKTELYVPVVTSKTSDSFKLTKFLSKGFKRSVFWNEYKSKIQTVTQAQNDNSFKRSLLDSSFQGVNRFFVMGFNAINNDLNEVKRDSHRKYFLPRVDIKNYNVLIDGRNFYDQNINDELRKYDEVRKISSGKGDDYTTGCLLDYHYYKNHYKLIVCNLKHPKILDSDPRAVQQLEFTYMLDNTNNNTAQIFTVLEKENETVLEFGKGTVKVL